MVEASRFTWLSSTRFTEPVGLRVFELGFQGLQTRPSTLASNILCQRVCFSGAQASVSATATLQTFKFTSLSPKVALEGRDMLGFLPNPKIPHSRPRLCLSLEPELGIPYSACHSKFHIAHIAHRSKPGRHLAKQGQALRVRER